jgi:hypothetical protein
MPPCNIERLESRTLFAGYTAATPSELIAAINSANQSSQADTITLVAGKSFSLTVVNNTTHGPTGLPAIVASGGPLTILGNGDTIERSAAAGSAFRLFDVAGGATLTLKKLTLQGGLAAGSQSDLRSPARGGAVYSQGALSLESVIVQNNSAQGSAGVFVWGVLLDGEVAQGGGLYSAGSLSLSNCTFRGNRAIGGAGLDKAWYTIQGNEGTGSFETVFRGSIGGDASGGGIYVASGTAVMLTSTMTPNSAMAGTGGEGKGTSIADGVYIGSSASVGIDTFSKKLLKKSDTFGKYNLI